jgi:AcrR family transcriptional regulator
LLEADLALLRERLDAALSAPTGNRERIRASFQAYFDFVDEHAEGFRLLMQEAVGGERQFRDMVGRFRDEILKEVAELILREARGHLDQAKAEALALGLIGMVETAAQHNPGDSKPERRRAVNTLVRLAWKGISGLTL